MISFNSKKEHTKNKDMRIKNDVFLVGWQYREIECDNLKSDSKELISKNYL